MKKEVKKELGMKEVKLLDKNYFIEEADKINKLILKDNASIKDYQALNGTIETIERFDKSTQKLVASKSSVLIKINLKDRFQNEWIATLKASASNTGVKSQLIGVIKTLDTRKNEPQKTSIDLLSQFNVKVVK